MPAPIDVLTTSDANTLAFSVEGTGPALLLFSGQGTSMAWWDRMVPALRTSFTTVRFDYPGTGGSTAAHHAAFSTRRFAATALELLDHLGIGQAHVFGTSMGGKVAQWFALDAPERIGKLVLGCAMVGGTRSTLMGPAATRRFMLPGDAGIEARLSMMYTDDYLAANEPNRALALGPAGRRAILGHWKASSEHDTSSLAASITAPTLLLHGDADEIVPPINTHVLESLIPGSRSVILEGMRHGFFDEDSSGTATEIADFLLP